MFPSEFSRRKVKYFCTPAGPVGVDWSWEEGVLDGDDCLRNRIIAGLNEISLLKLQ